MGRKDAFINTNMYVEAFHRVLKYAYMKGKVNKRLDNCLYVLLKLARDKGFDRLIKIEKGKNTARINMIRERHQSSLKLCAALVNETEQNLSWEVTSRDRTSTYTVSLLNNTCPQQCEIRCYDCDISVHIYTCNCADALIRYTICKHIHLVARVTTDIVKPGENSDETPQHSSENLLQTIQDKNVCDIATLRNDLQTSLSGLSWQINMINDIETLRCIRKYINSAANLIVES